MKTKTPDIHKFVKDNFDLSLTTEKIKISDIYSKNRFNEIDEFKMYLAHFNTVPIYFKLDEIDCEQYHQDFINVYEEEILNVYYNKKKFRSIQKEESYEDVFYFLFEDLLVNFDFNQEEVRLLFRKTNIGKVDKIYNSAKSYRLKKQNEPEVSLLANTNGDVSLRHMKINFKDFNIEEHYNDDFLPIHSTIKYRLSNKNDKGIVLLHGKPGTGKTSYIKYLINKIDKKIIFLPPNMASALISPGLVPLLLRNKNSILVIEDAENILLDRGKTGNSTVSALLNLSDGILSDCLNIQLICSFNVEIGRVDNALLRKGRLIARYEFNELSIEKTNTLSKKLGYSTIFNEPKTLTEIYNQEEEDFRKPNEHSIKRIGFQNRNAS